MLVLAGALALFIPAGRADAQEIKVYSEFRRVDPFGEIIPQDRGGMVREILSPLLARNSHATFRVVVWAPMGEFFYLYVGTNPDKVFDITVYKELWTKREGVWIPDRLVPVNLPHLGHVPDPYHGIPNQKVETFLVDVWVPKDATPGRVKLEPQVNVGGRWAIYPMEVRVSDVTAPPIPPAVPILPPVSARSDKVVLGPLRAYLCGEEPRGQRVKEPTARGLIWRNVMEDLALARELEAERGADTVRNGLLLGLQMDVGSFCQAKEFETRYGPEWYLRGRDFLYKGKVDY
ncbi:MAG: hypothetical protein H5T84_04095 [Thermoleophilia bacterium]|nr:hypothetical protein [Thermoleophilia bacterium]